jgi:hypothetical protein
MGYTASVTNASRFVGQLQWQGTQRIPPVQASALLAWLAFPPHSTISLVVSLAGRNVKEDLHFHDFPNKIIS